MAVCWREGNRRRAAMRGRGEGLRRLPELLTVDSRLTLFNRQLKIVNRQFWLTQLDSPNSVFGGLVY